MRFLTFHNEHLTGAAEVWESRFKGVHCDIVVVVVVIVAWPLVPPPPVMVP